MTQTKIKGGVTQSLPHDSAKLHVTGQAIYVDDVPELPQTLHAVIVYSRHPHARIKSIDTRKALAMEGVATVITAADIPGHNDIAPILQNEPALAEEIVEYAGQPVAAVAATSFELAQKAALKVVVDYEILEPVLSIEKALEKEQYLTQPQKIEHGDWKQKLENGTNRLQGKMTIGGQDHFYLEGQVSYALPKEDNCFFVYCSTQHPTEAQLGVSHVLGIPQHRITVEQRRMGGGFGGKESQSTLIAAIAALLANATKKPVKLRLNRDDDMIVTGKRHHFLAEYDVAFDDNGRIEAIDMMYGAGSGNVADLSPPVVQRCLCHADNCYYFPASRIRGFLCKTNTVSNTAFRGFGGPQGMIGIEQCMDHIANALGKSPIEVRKANYYGKTERNVAPYGQVITDNIIDEVVDDLLNSAEFKERRAEIDEFNAKSPIIKRGLAMNPTKFGISFNAVFLNQAGALVHLYRDGTFMINQGGTEMGQGLFMKMCQVVASIFEVDVDKVKITATRTDKVPNTSPTAASSDCDINGMAIKDAANKIKGRLIEFAARHFKVLESAVKFENNQVIAGDNTLDFNDFVGLAYMNRVSLSANGFYKTPKIHFDPVTMTGNPFYYYTYGACVSEVAVDTLTGEVRVLRADMLHDCGTSLNPALDMGQVEGGYVQGMGWMTMEELWWDNEGVLRTHAPSTYKIPVSRDVPPVFNVNLLENSPNREDTIFHSKATGEPPLMQALSVWLAVRDACEAAVDHKIFVPIGPPCTAENVLKAIEEAKKSV